jgi:hypothetical protein
MVPHSPATPSKGTSRQNFVRCGAERRRVEAEIRPDLEDCDGLRSCDHTPARPWNQRVQNRQRRVVDDEPGVDDVDDLKDCHDKVERLREEKQELEVENEVLRESADTFGELAERLNKKIKNEAGD